LFQLKVFAQDAIKRRDYLAKSAGGGKGVEDLLDPKLWSPSDMRLFARRCTEFEPMIADLSWHTDAQRALVRELEAATLKSNTKREEITQIEKAQSNKEFTKMMKSRVLGADHAETQMQMRKKVTVLRNRIQQLEDHLQASKKRLQQVSTGKAALRAPSLTVLNQTYSNIDRVIRAQATDVSDLAERVSKINLSSPSIARSRRVSADSPLSVSRKPIAVSQSVAISTAGALNAERKA
ncbi:hypothetical protein FISHEDRAFT_9851, partial [Fistulina hepatica ATCC 64428]